MAEDTSIQRDKQERTHQPRYPIIEHKNSQGPEEAHGAGSYPFSLFNDHRAQKRGNAPVRTALMLQMQQTYGNRAVQRLLEKSRNKPVMVLQLERDWVGFDAEKYRERFGKFQKFNSETNQWVDQMPPEREIVSQYFGGAVREEAPPDTIGVFEGFHVKAVS